MAEAVAMSSRSRRAVSSDSTSNGSAASGSANQWAVPTAFSAHTRPWPSPRSRARPMARRPVSSESGISRASMYSALAVPSTSTTPDRAGGGEHQLDGLVHGGPGVGAAEDPQHAGMDGQVPREVVEVGVPADGHRPARRVEGLVEAAGGLEDRGGPSEDVRGPRRL